MKLIDGVLYLEFDEMVECGVSSFYLKKAKSLGTKCWHFIKDPIGKGSKVLVGYEQLKDEYKSKVHQRFGNPYDLCARQPILDMVIADPTAHDFFFSYKYDLNGKPMSLTADQVAKSTRSAAWLSLIAKVNERQGWNKIKEAIGLKYVPEFYTHAAALIQIEKENGKSETYNGARQLPGKFPFEYQNLKTRAAKFAEEGFETCLPTGLANKGAAKIGKTEDGYDAIRAEEQIAVIRKVAALHMNLDAAQVNTVASAFFKEKGWTTLSDARVYQIMQENKALLTPGRNGKKAYNNTVAMQIKRKAPDYPTQYWTLDGWTVELLFQEDGKYHHRLDMVVVLDPFNKYPVGFAIGEHENAELIRMANRNALLHIAELTGGYYRPQQIQSDNYAMKQLTPFFQAMAHLHTPAAVGNAKSKVIEPYFKYLNKKYCQLQSNWGGFNITAKGTNQPNREMLHMIRHGIPDRKGLLLQIMEMMEKERALKLDAFLEGWSGMPVEKRLPVAYMGLDWLRVFGQPLGRTNDLTGQGITKKVGGKLITYDCFDPIFRKQITTDWQVYADELDFSKVLVISPDAKQQFVLEQKRTLPMAASANTLEDWQHLSQVKEFNKARVAEITQTYASDTAITSRLLADQPMLDKEAEQILKIMPIVGGQQKEQLQIAKGLRKRQVREEVKALEAVDTAFAAQRQEYLGSKININDYL